MQEAALAVRHVAGRHGRRAFRGEAVIATVTQDSGQFRIRLDSEIDSEFWIELLVEMEPDQPDEPLCIRRNGSG